MHLLLVTAIFHLQHKISRTKSILLVCYSFSWLKNSWRLIGLKSNCHVKKRREKLERNLSSTSPRISLNVSQDTAVRRISFSESFNTVPYEMNCAHLLKGSDVLSAALCQNFPANTVSDLRGRPRENQ